MKILMSGCLAIASVLLSLQTTQAEQQWIYIASPAKPAVIYRCTLDLQTGAFGKLEIAAENVNTGFMAMHPTESILYAGTTEKVKRGVPNGFVRAYHLDEKSGHLKQFSIAPTEDKGVTHIEVSPLGNVVLTCHYSGEGTSAIPLKKNGELVQKVSRIKHEGSGGTKRQTRPHPHGVAIHKEGKFVCVADLGNDHIEVFGISPEGELSKCSRWQSAPGAGPRHVSFHPNGKWLYCINELDNTLVLLDFDASCGKLKEVQAINTLPEGYKETSYTAEIAIHPNGTFLYGSNRGHNSTVVCQINQNNGKLSVVEHEPTQGDHPRFIGIDPTGSIYLAANMNANSIVSFHVDKKTGALKPSGHTLEVARPMCVLFVEKK